MRGPRDRGGARFDSVWTSASLAADGRLLVLSVAEYVVFVSDLLYSRRVEIVQITLIYTRELTSTCCNMKRSSVYGTSYFVVNNHT